MTVRISMGTGATSIPSRLDRGEAVDVAIVADDALRQLIAAGLVRSGAPNPDISTVDALKRTLFAATSIAYSASVSGRYLSTELFERLGVADQVMGKSHRVEGVWAPWWRVARRRLASSRSASYCPSMASSTWDRSRQRRSE